MVCDRAGQSQTLCRYAPQEDKGQMSQMQQGKPVRSEEEVFIMRVGGEAQEEVAQGSGGTSIVEFQTQWHKPLGSLT